MWKYLKYYIVPLLSISVLIGIYLGGHWMWLGFFVLLIVVVGGDAILGEDDTQPEYSYPWLLEIPLHLALPIIILILPGLGIITPNLSLVIFSLLVPWFVIYTHRSNISRIRNGTENRFDKTLIFKKRK